MTIEVLDERRRCAVKLRLTGMKLAQVSAAVELAKGTIISATKAYRKGGSPLDGFLRSHQIHRASLSADLVVLSACRTGLGNKGAG